MAKFRNNRRRKQRPSGFDVLDAELIPLTNELINSLVRRGMKRKDIEEFRSMGLHYCPSRDSFMSPWMVV